MTMSPANATWPEYEAAVTGQANAALPDHSVWVEANAGSGKTKVLIDRVARLLLGGARPDAILCVTYTKAAASEMQARLFDRLGAWCVMDEAALVRELTSLQGKPPEDINQARELFAQALETPGGLRIETIHAFCGRLLRRFPLEAGVPPGFRELDDADSAELWDRALRALGAHVVRGHPELIDAARIVAEGGARLGQQGGVLSSLHSASTRIQSFIDMQGGIEGAIARLKSITGAGDESAEAILTRVMGSELPRADLTGLVDALPECELQNILHAVLSEDDDETRFAAYLSVMLTKSGGVRKRNAYTAPHAKSCPSLVDLFQIATIPEGSEIERLRAACEQISARRLYERSAALLRLCALLFEDFDRRKRARAGLDFDDLIDSASALLTRKNAAEWVLWKLDGGIDHVLLDEAQDTAPSQWTILRALTDDIFAGAGTERDYTRTLFVVGDQKQSIYSFQGADPERFMEEARKFLLRAIEGEVAHQTPSMAMSFRSAPEVLDYVDAAFDISAFNGEAPFALNPPTEADQMRHTAHRRNESGTVELWPIELKPEIEEGDPWDTPIGQESDTNAKALLAGRIAKWIREQIDNGVAIWEKGRRSPCGPGDFLILVKGRTGGLFDAILQQLKRQHLPVAGADRLNLLDSLPVQDLLNLIRFALCPSDDLVLAEILKGPFGGLDDDADLFPLAAGRARGETVWYRLQASTEPRHPPIRAFLNGLLSRTHLPPFEFLTAALERQDELSAPGWDLILARLGGPAREPVTALIDRAAAFDVAGPSSLQLFLDAIETAGGEVKRELSGPQGEVRVMTVHGAKGLQAPIVILPDTTSAPRTPKTGLFVLGDSPIDGFGLTALDAGAPLWPGAKADDSALTERLRALENDKALREHRRLLYVALTRAQDRLIVCGAQTGNSKAGYAGNSWYQICEAGMSRLAEDARLSSDEADGRPVRRFGAQPESMAPADDRSSVIRPPAWITQPAPRETDPERIVAPTAFGGGDPPVLAPFGEDRSRRLLRGRLIHTLFEGLPALPAKERSKAAQRFLERQTGLEPAERKEIAAATLRVLEDSRFAPLFGPGSRAEAPIVGRLGDDIINGRVDRLVISDDEILIVDFKTDRPAPPDVSDVALTYQVQMAVYRSVLSTAYPNRPIRCLLAWTDGPSLMEIPTDMLDQALRSVSR